MMGRQARMIRFSLTGAGSGSGWQHYCIVWPELQRIDRHSRLPVDHVAAGSHVGGAIPLDLPGITVTVEAFCAD
jgi:hypothetical protein